MATHMTTYLTPHFTQEETVTTSTGILNLPNPTEATRILNTAHHMELVRACLNRLPIKVNSWFRGAAVNAAVGGSANSEHRVGAAVDFICPLYGTPFQICQTLVSYSNILNYNQLIFEQTWVHISFPLDGTQGKREVLTYKNGKYTQGLVA